MVESVRNDFIRGQINTGKKLDKGYIVGLSITILYSV